MNGNSKTLLLLGATSGIGRAVALVYAKAGWNIQLAGRDSDAVRREADDLGTRTGALVSVHELDVLVPSRFELFCDSLPTMPDTVICAVGALGEQRRAEQELDHASHVLRSNFEGPALLLSLFANHFARRGSGTIIGLSSVAGDRGRGSNYVYGAAKAGFTAFLSGLRNRLTGSGVRVVTVKPGFVRTPMTAAMKLPPLLTAEPLEVAEAVFAAAEITHGPDVVYICRLWWPVMLLIRALPEPIFKRLKL